jgi:acyl carrier protein
MTPAIPQSKEEIYPWVANILHEMFELDKSKITPQANLYTDLEFKDLTGKRLRPEVFKSVRTVQDVVNALSTLLVE